MKIFKYKVLATVLLTILTSCNQKDDETSNPVNENSNDVKVVELSQTSNFQVDELGIYGMEFDQLNDFTLRNKITRYRYSDGIKEYLSSYALTNEATSLEAFSQVDFGDFSYEKTSDIMEPKFLRQYRAKNGEGIEEKVHEVSKTMFGKEQTFNVKTSNYEIEESQYIPELITINNIGYFDESLNKYRASKSNLSVEYNTDVNNDNGVALLMLWDGTTQDMNVQELATMDMAYKYKTVVYAPNDNGILNVPQSALSKYPENANLTLVLMRGNAKIIKEENIKHYLVTSSEQYERIVLE